MKKLLCVFFALMLMATTAFAASFEIDDNPDFRSPVIDPNTGRWNDYRSTYADTSKPVDFNNKSTGYSNFYGMKSADWFGTEYEFSWIPGPSGEEGDWAPYVSAIGNSVASKSGQLYLFYQGGDHKLKEGGGVIYAEFDLMVNTTTDRLELADIPLWNVETTAASRYMLTDDGYMKGTDYQYKAGEWMHFKMVIDMNDLIWNVWVDDTHAVDNKPFASKYSWDKNTRFQFFVRQTTEKQDDEPKAGFAVDNFLIYADGRDISEFMTLGAFDSNGNEFSGDDVCVNPQIKLNCDFAPDASLVNGENIVLQNQSGAQIPCTYALDGSDIVIIPRRTLGFEETYRVKISDEFRKAQCLYRPMTGRLSFATGNNRDVVVSSPVVSDMTPGKPAKINATLTNNTGDSYDIAFMAALYNSSNGLVSVSRKLITLSEGENHPDDDFTLDIPEDATEDYSLKLYVTPADGYRIIDTETVEN